MASSDIWPAKGSSTHKLLTALLNGRQMTVLDTLMEFNLMTPNARVSELRAKGWPIRSLKMQHPHLLKETMTAYYMEIGFRSWWLYHNGNAHPKDYPAKTGRGKFVRSN